MNTNVLMVLSALFMAVLGVIASFLPREILAHSGVQDGGVVALVVQIAGALYLEFAFLNWMARANIMGGIYGRPVVLGNLLHFVVVTLALWKAVIAGQHMIGIVVGAGPTRGDDSGPTLGDGSGPTGGGVSVLLG